MVLPVAVPSKVRSSRGMAGSASSSAQGAGYYGSPSYNGSAAGSISQRASGSLTPRTSALSSSSSRGFVTDSFVKIEGFEFDTQQKPQSPKLADNSGPSLLTRELGGRSPSSRPGTPTHSMLHRQASKNSSDREFLSPGSVGGVSGIGGASPCKPPVSPSPQHLQTLLADLQKRYSVFNDPLVIRAFNMSRLAHDGNVNSGAVPGPTFEKCVSSAVILADLGADETAVSAALLHDCLDGRMLTEAQMRPMLGSEATVEHVKSTSHASFLLHRFEQLSPVAMQVNAPQETSPECLDFINLLLSHASPKALLVTLSVALAEMKLCADAVRHDPSMVHNVYVQKVAHQAMNVWAPLANRIGVWSIKSQLEDLSFSCLLPTEHTVLARCLRPAQEPTSLVRIMDGLRAALVENGIEHLDLTGRPKHLWGVWCKMQKKGYSAEQVQDVRGLRVIVSSREDCYKALRAIETSWKVVGQSKNYIKEPKKNGYQSLHVIADPGDGHLVEVQIRTDKMHYLAEYGADASHWKYKEKSSDVKATKAAKATGAEDDARAADASATTANATNWAKFETQKHVSIDQKFRPSGSPTEDKSLERIMAAWREQTERANNDNVSVAEPAETSTGTADQGGPVVSAAKTNNKPFHQYIQESGQVLAPPDEETSSHVVVALVRGGVFVVENVAQGTTVGDLLNESANEALSLANAKARVIVNRVEVSSRDFGARLKNGDAVEVHYVGVSSTSPASTIEVSPVSPPSQSNLMPLNGRLGGLTSKLRRVNL